MNVTVDFFSNKRIRFFMALLICLLPVLIFNLFADFPFLSSGDAYWAHSIINSIIMERNLPVENPWFSGAPLHYPYAAHLVLAVFQIASSVPVSLILPFSSVLSIILIFSVFYCFSKRLGARNPAFFSMITILGLNIAWIVALADLYQGCGLDLECFLSIDSSQRYYEIFEGQYGYHYGQTHFFEHTYNFFMFFLIAPVPILTRVLFFIVLYEVIYFRKLVWVFLPVLYFSNPVLALFLILLTLGRLSLKLLSFVFVAVLPFNLVILKVINSFKSKMGLSSVPLSLSFSFNPLAYLFQYSAAFIALFFSLGINIFSYFSIVLLIFRYIKMPLRIINLYSNVLLQPFLFFSAVKKLERYILPLVFLSLIVPYSLSVYYILAMEHNKPVEGVVKSSFWLSENSPGDAMIYEWYKNYKVYSSTLGRRKVFMGSKQIEAYLLDFTEHESQQDAVFGCDSEARWIFSNSTLQCGELLQQTDSFRVYSNYD